MIQTIETTQAPAAIGPYSQAKACGGFAHLRPDPLRSPKRRGRGQ